MNMKMNMNQKYYEGVKQPYRTFPESSLLASWFKLPKLTPKELRFGLIFDFHISSFFGFDLKNIGALKPGSANLNLAGIERSIYRTGQLIC